MHTKHDTLSPTYFLFGVKYNQSYWQRQKLTVLHFPLVVMDKLIALDIQLSMDHMELLIYIRTNTVLHIELKQVK